jgi:hypothetical protein
MNTVKLSCSLLLIIIIVSCEVVVDVNIPLEAPKLTVNSFFTADSVWSADITLSRFILDDQPFEVVPDAEIIIYHNNVAVDTLQNHLSGRYIGKKKPETGKSYEIRVNHQRHGAVHAVSYAPVPVIPDSIHANPKFEVESNETNTFTLYFNDPPAENFYQIQLWQQSYYLRYPERDTVYIFHTSHFTINDPVVSRYHGNVGALFDDTLFNGRKKSIELKTNTARFHPTTGYIVYFRTVTKEFYEYMVRTSLQDVTSGDPLAQPVQVFSNIENGFGIFAGYNQAVYRYSK